MPVIVPLKASLPTSMRTRAPGSWVRSPLKLDPSGKRNATSSKRFSVGSVDS